MWVKRPETFSATFLRRIDRPTTLKPAASLCGALPVNGISRIPRPGNEIAIADRAIGTVDDNDSAVSRAKTFGLHTELGFRQMQSSWRSSATAWRSIDPAISMLVLPSVSPVSGARPLSTAPMTMASGFRSSSSATS